jgi:hypothetical protein
MEEDLLIKIMGDIFDELGYFNENMECKVRYTKLILTVYVC